MENKKYSLIKEGEGEFSYIDQDGCHWDTPKQWLWGILGGCGCGSSEEFEDRALYLLNYFASEHDKRDYNAPTSPYNDLTNEVLTHWMDSKDLIEHGTSIGGSWLTEKGKAVYESIINQEK